MALSNETASLRAMEAAGLTDDSLPTILSLVPSALEVFSKRVAADDTNFRGMQKGFTGLTITAGVLDLSITPKMLFNPLRSIVYTSSVATAKPVQWLWDIYMLHFADVLNDGVFYAQDGQKLIFLSTDGAINTLASTTARITANYIPLITEVPFEYEGAFIETLAEMALNSLRKDLMKASVDARELASVSTA